MTFGKNSWDIKDHISLSGKSVLLTTRSFFTQDKELLCVTKNLSKEIVSSPFHGLLSY